jgi:hypothetical protein
MPEPFEQVTEAPPGARGLDGDRRPGWELREELFQSSRLVGEAVRRQLALCRHHHDRRDPLVKIAAHGR